MPKILRVIITALTVVPITLGAALLVHIFGISRVLRGSWPGRGDRFPMGALIRRYWARIILKIHGIQIEVAGPGASYLTRLEDGYVITSNHQSALDIFAQAAILPDNSFFFAKRELLFVPVFGWAAAFGHTVYVNRKKGMRDQSALKFVRKLVERGDNLIIYPEGTRSRSAKLKSFKRGAFVMAIQLQKPVLPMTIVNSYELMGPSNLYFRPGRLRIWVDEPVSTKGLSEEDRFQLCDRIWALIRKNLDQMQ